MFNKLRSNYKLSRVLVRIAFVLAYMFCNWQAGLLAATQTCDLLLYTSGINLTAWCVPIALVAQMLIGAVLMFIVPFLANTFLNASRFYNVPRAEYGLLALLFFTIYYLICGALKSLNLITPLLLVWGGILFPVLVSLGCTVWFYRVTAKLYFNDVTAPFYFRNLAIVYLICAAVFGVIL